MSAWERACTHSGLLGRSSWGSFPGLHIERVPVEELADDFLREYRINHRKSLDDAEARWHLHLKPFFAAMRVTDVSSGLIARYVDARQQEGAANATINRELAALKRMFRLGQQATPPKVLRIPAFPRLKENNARTGFLTDSQRDALAAECAKVGLWLRAMFEVGCSYCWRVSEVKNLRVRHVDIGSCTIRLDPGTTKNDQGRVVKFERGSTLCELLSACVHGKYADDFVFTREDRKPVRIQEKLEKCLHSRWSTPLAISRSAAYCRARFKACGCSRERHHADWRMAHSQRV